MATTGEIYFGRPGALITLPHPRDGVQLTYDRPTAVFRTGTGGARGGRTLGGKRQFTLNWAQLWYETYADIEAFHQGHEGPGPFVIHDPARVNWLMVNQSGATSQSNDTSNFTVAGSGVNLSSSSSAYRRGPRSLRTNFTYAVSGAVVLDSSAQEWPGIPVIAGQAVVFSCYAQGAGADAIMSVTPQLQWYDDDGTLLSISAGTPLTTAAGSFQVVSVTATPPASAVYVLCRLLITGSSIGSVLYLDEFQLERGSSPTSWRPGTGVFPVMVSSLSEVWPWQAGDDRTGPVLVLQETGE